MALQKHTACTAEHCAQLHTGQGAGKAVHNVSRMQVAARVDVCVMERTNNAADQRSDSILPRQF